MAQCLRDKGWDAAVEQDPVGFAVSYEVLPEQEFAAEEDSKSCEKQLGFDKPPPPLSREELEKLYYKQLDTKECLEAEHYSIEEPPSLEVFVENQGNWIAYGSLDPRKDQTGNPEEWARINDVCPQP